MFFFCPYSGNPPPHRFDINIGVAYLAGYLQKQGLNTAFYFGRYDNDPVFGQMLEYIARMKPRSVGFTVYGSNLPETIALSKAIKSAHPEMPIIWGGPEIRYKPEQIASKYQGVVDFCIAGEGEKPLTHLLTSNTFLSEKLLAGIPGISFRNPSTGRILSTPPGSTILRDNHKGRNAQNALDIYPSPYLEGIIPEDYFRDKTVVSIFTSRGCPFKCVYCQFSALNEHRVHFHSVDRVMAEIEWIHGKVLKFHPDKEEVYIMIFDEALTLSRKRIQDLCERLIDKHFEPPVKLWIDTRADYVDEALVKLLKKSGAKKINFGLESAVPQVLKQVGKVSAHRNHPASGVKGESRFLRRVQKAVKWSKEEGLYTTVSIIVGLPTETMEDARQTLKFVEDLDVDLYYHNFLNVLEGTALAKKAKGLGYEWNRFPTGYMGKYGHRHTNAPIPTRSLAPLKNAMVFQRDRNRFGVLLRGWNYDFKCRHQSHNGPRYKPFALQLATDSLDQDFKLHFLPQYAGLSTTIFCQEDASFSEEALVDLFARVPLKNGRLYRMPNLDRSLTRIRGIEEADQSTPYYIPYKYLAEFNVPDDGRRVFVTISDDEDFECLVRFVRDYKSAHKLTLSFEQAELLHFDLFESCRWFRWFDRSCPAAWLTHIYSDKHQGLHPCLHFASIGSVKEKIPHEVFHERILAFVRKKTEERGCSSCPIDSKCPQCVTPYPLTDAEYCKFQLDYLA